MREAEEKLYEKGYYIMNQSDGFFGTIANEYELYKTDKCVMDHLTESQVIALSTLLQKKEGKRYAQNNE